MPGADTPVAAALVITYTAWPVVGDTLRALVAEPLVDRIVVVDNASPDDTAGRIEAGFRTVDVLRAPRNLGYAGAFNLGIAALDGAPTILVVTHDTLFAPGAIAVLADTLKDAPPSVAAVGPLLAVRTAPQVIWSAGGMVDRRKWIPVHAGSGDAVAAWSSGEPRQVEWLDGACVLFRSGALRATGPMDEGFFLYYEELDYFARLREAGYVALCAPAAVAYQQPANAPPYLMTRNRLRAASRQGGRRAVARVLGDLVVDEMRKTIRRRATGRNQRLLGVAHFLLGRDGPPPAHVPLVPSSETLDR